jgi:hypothetical protein
MMRQIATQYQEKYVSCGRLPRGWVERPVQLACQNVIIGLSAFAHDAEFDGLRVPAYLTCEVPHLATHEGNRALCALMLCDAYHSGGTDGDTIWDSAKSAHRPTGSETLWAHSRHCSRR